MMADVGTKRHRAIRPAPSRRTADRLIASAAEPFSKLGRNGQ